MNKRDNTLAGRLEVATNEDKQVNPIYVSAIAKGLTKTHINRGGQQSNQVTDWMDSEEIIYPEIKTDGVYKCYYIDDSDGMQYNYLLQLECKLDVDFNNEDERAKTLLQVICYLKQIHDNVLGYNATWESNQIPRVIVIGSKLNCFTLPSQPLIHYAMGHITGFKSASTAYMEPENRGILDNIKRDAQIKVMSIIYDTHAIDCVQSLCENIVKLARNLKITDDLSETTISKAFDYFDMNVLDKKQSSKMTSREKVSIFIGIFFSDEFSQTIEGRDATDINVLTVNGTKIKVDPDNYNKFKLLYSTRSYSRYEEKQITAITDRLLEDTDRRRKGDFYTPTIWVDEAHKLLDKNLGSNWRDEYIVWDCAWGTGNLTRDYNFKELYCSTINQEELNIGARYNKNATKFQYDFLNDDVEEFETIRLKSVALDIAENDTIKNMLCMQIRQILVQTKLYNKAKDLINRLQDDKKLLFLINPPYGTSTDIRNIHTKESMHKQEISLNKTYIYENTSRNLYVQFILRIISLVRTFELENVKLGIFCPTSLLTYNENRNALIGINKLLDGFIIQASNFANVSGSWGIMFGIFDCGLIDNKNIKDIGQKQVLKILDISSNNNCGVNYQDNKTLYYLENKFKANKWTQENIKGIPKSKNHLYLKSALSIADKCGNSTCDIDFLGGLLSGGNKVEENNQSCAIASVMFNNAKSLNIVKSNYNRIISYFTARRLICGQYATWINCKDEYMIPNTEHPLYSQWQSDCIVYSLFNTASQQSSLRNIEYNGNIWNIQNEFFWLSVREIEKLAGGFYDKDDINTIIEDDIELFGKERFVYQKLQEVTLSPDAQAVLDKATEILKKTFKYRKQFNINHPEYQINTWDAGWYQIKALAKEYTPDDLKQFNELYKALGDRMRPLVYELGFLYK